MENSIYSTVQYKVSQKATQRTCYFYTIKVQKVQQNTIAKHKSKNQKYKAIVLLSNVAEITNKRVKVAS